MEKIFANYESEEGSMPKIYKEFLPLNNTIINNGVKMSNRFE